MKSPCQRSGKWWKMAGAAWSSCSLPRTETCTSAARSRWGSAFTMWFIRVVRASLAPGERVGDQRGRASQRSPGGFTGGGVTTARHSHTFMRRGPLPGLSSGGGKENDASDPLPFFIEHGSQANCLGGCQSANRAAGGRGPDRGRGYAFVNVNVEAYPYPAPAIIEVIAQFPGASAEEVERQVTIPLEIALAGMPGLQSTRSKSLFGLAHLRNQFDYGRDFDQAKQDVINRLAVVTLPAAFRRKSRPRRPLARSCGYSEMSAGCVRSPDLQPQRPQVASGYDPAGEFLRVPRIAGVVTRAAR